MSGTNPLTSSAVTCYPTGGVGPYTYQWQYVSGNNFVGCNSPTSQTTTFGYNDLTGIYTSFWECKVTDSNGIVVPSENLEIDINSF